jgi:cell division protein FtsB
MSSSTQTLPRARTRLTARAAILAVIVTAIALLSIVPLRQHLGQQERIDELQRQAERLEVANRELGVEIERLHDDLYLERLARECLGVVKPGHTAFVTIPRDAAPPPTNC